jgi:hypothetical protein
MKQWMLDVVAACPDEDLKKYLERVLPNVIEDDLFWALGWTQRPEGFDFWPSIANHLWDSAISCLNGSVPNWREIANEQKQRQ